MKLREKFKRFWTLDVHNHEGFTLVELIIVIAILAILSGVAVAGYSTYVKKANMQADRTMVAQLISAIELASYMDSDNIPDGATLYLSTENAYISGDDEGKLAAILTDAYGSNFASRLKLKYKQWGLGGTISTYANQLSKDLNGNDLTFQNDVDDLWNEVESILLGLQTVDQINSMFGSSAGLMGAASSLTVDKSIVTSKEEFAEMWANPADGFNSYIDAANDGSETANMTALLAQSAANKGRNYAFGNYIASDAALSRLAPKFMSDTATNGISGYESFSMMLTQMLDCTESEANALVSAINTYFGGTFARKYETSSNKFGVEVSSLTANTDSPAYYDGLGYYTLMLAVDDSSAETKDMSNEEYLDTMASAVHNVGGMLNDPSVLENVKDGCVAISIKKNSDGTLLYYITPANIYAGSGNVQSGVGQSTVQMNNTVTVTIDCNNEGVFNSFVVDGALALKVGEKGTVNLTPGSNFKKMAEDEGQDAAAYLESLGFLADLTSDNTSVVTVENGSVTAVGTGTAVLSVSSSDGVLFSINVTVVK